MINSVKIVKTLFSLTATFASALVLTPCFAGLKEDVQAALGRLADAPNYAWTTRTHVEGSQWQTVDVHGKAQKDGWAVVSQERDGARTVAVLKGESGVVQTDAGWQSAEDLRGQRQGGGGGGGALRTGMLLRSRTPLDEAKRALGHIKEWSASADGLGGDLTEAGARELMAFGRGGRGGGAGGGPDVSGAKGSVRYWLKDGHLAKIEIKVSGTYSFNNNDRFVERTTTYELKDIGKTTVEVPAAAKTKLGS